jgi:precorrin-3B methylase
MTVVGVGAVVALVVVGSTATRASAGRTVTPRGHHRQEEPK